MRKLLWVPCILAFLIVPRPCEAQLATQVSDLVLNGITTAGGPNPAFSHAGHFMLGASQGTAEADQVFAEQAIVTFNDRMKNQLTNFPLGSSSGGFTYTFDSTTGAFIRSSTSFGPAFTERAVPLGRGRFSVGMNYEHTTFSSFGGESLRNGAITFYLPHTDCCAGADTPFNPSFEGDWMQVGLDIKAKADTFLFLANAGLTDRLDVGVALPFTRVSLDTVAHATILRLATAGTNPPIHTFVQGEDVISKDFSSSGSASGVGDIVLRSKYNVYRTARGGVAAAVDLKLPTGDSDNLLGVGTTQAKVYVIASTEAGRFSPHINFGYTASGAGDLTPQFGVPVTGVSDEVNYAGGTEFTPNPRVTLIGDIIGRTLRGAGTIAADTISLPYGTNLSSSTNPVSGQPYRQLAWTPGNLNLVLGSAGVKYNPSGNVLLTGNVLFPLTSGGLKSKVSFVLGVDIAFGG
jgi:hypothetical protein